MNTALFVLVDEYRALAERLADMDLDPQTVADTLEGASGAIELKSQSIAYVALNFEAAAKAIKEHAAAQLDRAKAIQNRADSLRAYLQRGMEGAGLQKIEGPGVVIGFRKSAAVVIYGADLIPDEYMRQPETPPPAPDKKAIGEAIKAGREVPGAIIELRQNLYIK